MCLWRDFVTIAGGGVCVLCGGGMRGACVCVVGEQLTACCYSMLVLICCVAVSAFDDAHVSVHGFLFGRDTSTSISHNCMMDPFGVYSALYGSHS